MWSVVVVVTNVTARARQSHDSLEQILWETRRHPHNNCTATSLLRLPHSCRDVTPRWPWGPRKFLMSHGPRTRYARLRVVRLPRMLWTFSLPPTSKKPLVNDPGGRHGTCVTHVPWCMSGSLTRGGGENVPRIPGACTTRNFCIW